MLASEIEDLISRSLAEDVGLRDLTGDATVAAGARAHGAIVQKQPGMLSGLDVAHAVLRRLDPLVGWQVRGSEGQWLSEPPAVVVEVEGDARALLATERVALNFLQHLSGIATLTASYVHELRGTAVQVLDTRKTLPGLRTLEKQAVVDGGGHNHRMGLYDAMLVKENHAALAGGLARATAAALGRRPSGVGVEVECRTLDDVREAIGAGADHLLLDNMDLDELQAAVAVAGERATLEASGGISLSSVKAVAGTGVQFISVGALTHSAPALDLSMTLEPLEEASR